MEALVASPLNSTVNPPLPCDEHSLTELDNYLLDKSYVNYSVCPTELDCELLDKISKNTKISQMLSPVRGTKPHLPHLYRWIQHISSFAKDEISLLSKNAQVQPFKQNLTDRGTDSKSLSNLDAGVRRKDDTML